MLSQLTVRARLLLLALVPLVMLLVVMGLALANASRLNQSFRELFSDRMQPISQLKIISDAYAVSIVDASHKYRAGVFDEARLRQNFGEARQRIEQSWRAYTATQLTDEEAARVRRIESMFAQANQLTDELLGEVDNGKLRAQEPKSFNERLYGAIDPLSGELEGLIKLQLDEGVKLNEQAQQQYRTIKHSFLQIGARQAVGAMQQLREQAQGSVEHARQSGEVLGHIASAIEGIADGNAQISTATEEQTAVANEISQNISSLNDSIQGVVNGAAQSSLASRDLAQLATGLQQQVRRFKA